MNNYALINFQDLNRKWLPNHTVTLAGLQMYAVAGATPGAEEGAALSDTRVYEPHIRARLETTAQNLSPLNTWSLNTGVRGSVQLLYTTVQWFRSGLVFEGS